MSKHAALLGLLALAVAGHGARLLLPRPGAPPGGVTLLPPEPGRVPSAAAHKDSIAAVSRPLGSDERIDIDRASVLEIARLPRVGVGLAKRIVADREANGPFRGLAGLDRVRGVGPGLLRLIEPHARFSAPPPVSGATGAGPAPGPPTQCVPQTSLTRSAVTVGCSVSGVALNQATAAELDQLPGIGPVRAAAIVRYREEHGPFRSVTDLARVPGINPALVQRLHRVLLVP